MSWMITVVKAKATNHGQRICHEQADRCRLTEELHTNLKGEETNNAFGTLKFMGTKIFSAIIW